MVLVYGNRNAEETIFKTQLDAWRQQNPERLKIEYIFSRQQTDHTHFGRIDRSKVAFLLNNKYQEVDFNNFFVCGPGDMIDTVTQALGDFGVSQDRVLFERFTVSEDAQTASEQAEVPAGSAQITYIIDDETTTLNCSTKDSVLDSAINNDLDPPYSCQGGICSSCIARVTDGKVEMRKNQILTDSEVADGLILTCQAHATTPTVTIDYDDV